MSPPTNVRSLNLIQWGVQLVGVACIYLGCLLNEVGVAAVIIALLLYNLSHWFSVALYPFRLLLWLLCCLLSPLSCLLTPFSCILTPLSRCLSLFNPWRWFAPKHRFLTQQVRYCILCLPRSIACSKLHHDDVIGIRGAGSSGD
jgi:hypothetical protein